MFVILSVRRISITESRYIIRGRAWKEREFLSVDLEIHSVLLSRLINNRPFSIKKKENMKGQMNIQRMWSFSAIFPDRNG